MEAGGVIIRSKTVTSIKHFKGDHRVLVSMVIKLAQSKIYLENPLASSILVPDRDSWELGMKRTRLTEVALELAGGGGDIHLQTEPCKLIGCPSLCMRNHTHRSSLRFARPFPMPWEITERR
jgi:hypothetical protein